MTLQLDIIPATGSAYHTTNIEDGVALADETLRRDEAYAAIVSGGKRYEVHIAHASGTADNPMSDAAIEAKFLANALPAIGRERAERVCDFVVSLETRPNVAELAALLA